MGKATLVIMAAGIGSRFGGGVKQLAPVGPNGEIIMDYSIYDAIQAGFDKVVFVIRKSLEQEFKEVIGKRIEKVIDVEYAYQELDDIPEPYKKQCGDRTKPWGTGQAILCCKHLINEPFLVINADDFYGRQSYEVGYEYLASLKEQSDVATIGMVGFVLGNTLSDNGGVTRGICKVSAEGTLVDVVETKNIVKTAQGAAAQTDEGESPLDVQNLVSMNMWAFMPEIFAVLEQRFEKFLDKIVKEDYTKGEYLLPTIVGEMLREKSAEVKVLLSEEKWFGITYKEDTEKVVATIGDLINAGVYPKTLYYDNKQRVIQDDL